jgi:leucyl/phenylalanyl-tRNA---protein transferase
MGAVERGAIPNISPEREPSLALPWWSPDPRGVIFIDSVHISTSLRRFLARCEWDTTVDRCFRAVIEGCVRSEKGRWITDEMVDAYCHLQALGYSHSIEVWAHERLIGGLYGVLVGGIFTAESMFFVQSNASKVALLDLAARLKLAGGVLIDTQTTSDHLKSMGATEVPRAAFLDLLSIHRERPVEMGTSRLPAARFVWE